MPKYTPEVEKARSEKLLKSFVENDMNITKTAKELGTSQQSLGQRLARKPVKDLLQKYLQSDKLKKKLIQVAEEGLAAKQFDMIGKAHPHHSVRHRFWRDILIATGNLKETGSGNVMIVLNYGHRIKPDISSIQPTKEE
jgi:hypothetical protein